MRKMKDSGVEWIGDIPESWDAVKLSYLFEIIGSGTTPTSTNSDYYDGEYNWLQTGDLNDKEITTTSKTITQKAVDDYSTLALYNKGTIVMAMYGATIGKLGILNIDSYTNQACCAMSRPVNIQPKFVYYWLMCNKENIVNLSMGGGQPNISQGIISTLKITIPKEITKQNEIVKYLDKKCEEIDALIKAKEKANELLKEQRQSIIYEAVTKGLNPDVPMKDSGIDWIEKIPESWRISRFRSEFSFGKGLPITKADLTEDGIGVVSYGQIHSKVNVGTSVKKEMIKFVNEKYMETNISSLTYTGDIIFADTSEDLLGCGNCVYVDTDEPIFAGYHTIIARPKERKNAKYYAYLFATDAWRSQIRAKAFGVKLFSITQAMLRDALIILPNETDMSKIVTFLDDKCSQIDTLIGANITTIEKLKEYRKSIIFEAVTGKVEI